LLIVTGLYPLECGSAPRIDPYRHPSATRCFGGLDLRTLLCCAHTSVYSLRGTSCGERVYSARPAILGHRLAGDPP
jgi:hypothetical protein